MAVLAGRRIWHGHSPSKIKPGSARGDKTQGEDLHLQFSPSGFVTSNSHVPGLCGRSFVQQVAGR
jgi:hypothetical protein